jgi:hypothetical protein
MKTQKKFESRIMEISFKDKDSEYFPQIKFESYKLEDNSKSIFQTQDSWMWLREEQFGDKYELRANDYKCACKTIKDAVEKINKFEKQREEFDEINRKWCEKEKQREESIKEIKIIENF